MDAALTQFYALLSALEQENVMLRSRLQSCEKSHALLQAEIAAYRRDSQARSSSEHRLIEATALAANALLTTENFDAAVNTALQILGEALETDRLAVADNFIPQSGSSFLNWRLLYEWDSPNTVPQIAHPDLAQGSWQGIEEWYERLNQGQSISYFIEDTPEPFRSVQAKSGAKALHSVPIFVEGKFWGQLGFDDCREAKRRSSAELSALKIAADCIGSAIQKNRTQQALLQAEQARSQSAAERSTELVRANAELQQRDRLLSVVAQVTKDLLDAEDMDIAIPAALQAVGEVANMSRVQLLLEQQDFATQKLQHIIAYEWTAEGIVPQINYPDAVILNNDNFEFILKELYIGHSVWRTVNDFPNPIRAKFESVGIQSSGTVPIFIEGLYIGGVGFDDCVMPRQWSQQEIDVLTAAAESIGAALHRTQLIDRLIAERIRAEQERAVELTQANEALRRCLDRLAGEPDLDSILHHILTEIVVQLNARGLAVFHYDVAAHTLNLANTFSNDHVPAPDVDPEELKSFTIPVPADITPYWQTLLQFRAPMILDANNLAHVHLFWPGTREWHLRWNQPISVGVPMLVGDEALGFLGLTFEGDVTLTPEQLSLAQALTHQATLAIKLMRLAEEAKQTAIAREQERAALERATELAKANNALKHSLDRLAQESDLDSFLGHVLGEIAHQVQAVAGHIFLLNVETNTLELRLEIQNGQLYRQAQPDEPTLFQMAVPANITPIFQYLCEKRTLASVNAGEFDNMTWTGTLEWFEREGFSEAVCLALIVGEQPVGMLGLVFRNKPILKPEEAELIHALAHQATLAIQLTRLAEEAKQVAIFEERNRMASEIHDTLAQVFTGISLQLEVAKPLVYQEPETVEQILEHISQLAGTGLTEARRSVWALYPPAAEYADLAQMLYDSVEHMTRNTAMIVEVNVQGDPCSLSPFIGMNLLRIGQEALTNALKHAHAQTVLIDLTYQPNQISLMIRDDGRGFVLPTNINSLNGGFGLVGMYERCDRIGAQLSVLSQLGQGTQILVEAPLGQQH